MRSQPTILEVMDMLHGWFRGASWEGWRSLLAALFALPMTPEQLDCYRRHTGRTAPPTAPAREAWLIIGRRGGKSFIAALVALFVAVFRSYAGILRPGERGVVMVVATDRQQARVVFSYLAAFFDHIPPLARLVQRRTRDAIHLSNRISIEIHTCSYRSIRGRTVVCFIGDEVAFWKDEQSANPDAEVIAAVRPAMATVPGAIMLIISTPRGRKGALYAAYRDHFGQNVDPVLVWQADTRTMNATVEEQIVRQAYADDAAVAASEWGADGTVLFRSDLESLVSSEVVERCTIPGRLVLPPVGGAAYVGFVDPSGGGPDSMTLGIAHTADGQAVLDLVCEVRPRFSPDAAVATFADFLEQYGVGVVRGDRYGGGWPAERFAAYGIGFELSLRTKSELYRDFLALLNSGRVELLDERRLRAQLLGLERRVVQSGRDTVDHAPGQHDDVINAAAGALLYAVEGASAEAQARATELTYQEWKQLRRALPQLGLPPMPYGGFGNIVGDGLGDDPDDECDFGRFRW